MNKLLLACLLSLSFSAFAAVDLNSDSHAELEPATGIGPNKAPPFSDYRKKNGSFKSVDDLDNVPGFGKKSVDAAKKDLTVGNAKAASSGKTAASKTIKEKAGN